MGSKIKKNIDDKSSENIIELKNICKEFDGETVVNDISLNIKRGEFVTLLGPSGCGKTTTLRMIAGFETPSSGTIKINGIDITGIAPYLRPVNTVFQRYALFPNLNVYQNIAFGLRLKKVPVTHTSKDGVETVKMEKIKESVIEKKVLQSLKMVDLTGYEDRDVNSLSGGQQQRVAIARAIVNEPQVLLLDEPLGALDLKMRKEMQLELKEMHKKLGITFIYVTHDQEEALTMSDTIVVMKNGIVHQIGSPIDIYNEPVDSFVADFIGESNIYNGVMIEDYKVKFDNTIFECTDKGFKHNQPIEVVLRPEDIYLLDPDNKNAHIKGKIISNIFKGMHYEMEIISENGLDYTVQDTTLWEVGEEVGMFIKPFDIHIMNKQRYNNSFETEIAENGLVYLNGIKVPCDTNSLIPNLKLNENDEPIDEEGNIIDLSGKRVLAEIDFNDIELTDNEEEGLFGGNVVAMLYKGKHYQVEVKTNEFETFFSDTTDQWDDGDRVGINIAKDKIKLTYLEETKNI